MTHCLIIGSGIVGLSTAYELTKNKFTITIIDDEKVGQASKSAAGILFPLNPWKYKKYMQELCITGHYEYNNFFNKLNKNEKKEINFSKKNLIIFGNNYKKAKIWCEKNNFIYFENVEDKLNNLEINIKEIYKNYLILKNINMIDPLLLINFYKKKLFEKKVKFKKEKILNINNFLKKKENHIYDYVIITAGTWSNEILNKNNVKLKPIKGQLLHCKVKKKIIDNILIYNDYYILPREEKYFIVGSTIEDVGYNADLTVDAKNYLKQSLCEIFSKKIDFLEQFQTFGFRPYSFTDVPYIKVDPSDRRIIYNFGHYRYGILTSIASAKIVKNFIV